MKESDANPGGVIQLRTKYDISNLSHGDTEWKYPVIKSPHKDCVVFPFRRTGGRNSTVIEEMLIDKISKYLGDQIEILNDAMLLLSDSERPFQPDIALIETKSGLNIRIDIEIDEPFDPLTEKPLHYIGCGDDFRDLRLNSVGWIVIRFSAGRVFNETKECVAYISRFLSSIYPEFKVPDGLKNLNMPRKARRWSMSEAQTWIVNPPKSSKFNEIIEYSRRLPIKDALIPHPPMDREEVLAAASAEHIEGEGYSPKNIDKSDISFERDRYIRFFPKEHTYYLYTDNTCTRLLSVSALISSFFKEFDTIYIARKVAEKENCPPDELLEKWECNGAMAREIGTFMHKQIENHFNNKECAESMDFSYEGNIIKCNESISLSHEKELFLDFIKENKINPFRTEWKIYDEELKVAGTIDLVSRDGDRFDIFDWKRSKKIDPVGRSFSFGINGLEHIPDTVYWHYCIQQNLYRYILEHKYKINVGTMKLVVLHPDNNKYQLLNIKRMDKELDTVFRYIKENGIQKSLN